jgi:VWFA-related protein
MMALPAQCNLALLSDTPIGGFMTIQRFIFALFVVVASGPFTAHAQTAQPAAAPSTHAMHIHVIAETKSGQPVTNLTQQDFTVLDNKSQRPITSFNIVTPADEPVEVIVLLDAVNMSYQGVAYARDGVLRFLKMNEGQLANPTSIAVLTDQGAPVDTGFVKDGNALSDTLQHKEIGLRTITRNSEWSGPDRLTLCINALHQLITAAGALPGRKIVLWVSPGWPLVSGPHVYLDTKQQQQIFNEVVQLSTQLRENHVTLYNLNPAGVSESLQQANYYEAFEKGIAKPSQAQLGNLAIQVLAAQSGGLVIEGNSDVNAMIQRSLLDAKSWYEIGFDPLPADKQNEYHHIEIKVGRPGVVGRTRDGYYANPVAITPR